MSGESTVTYKQYNWITAKEMEAEQAGLSKANAILGSQEFKANFTPKLSIFLQTWTDDQLAAFANGEISEMYIKPVLAYFWDLDRPAYPDVDVAEIVAEDLVNLQSAIDQKLKLLFESSAWGCLLNWARPRAQTAAVDVMNFRKAAKLEGPKADEPEELKPQASFDSVFGLAVGDVEITNKDKTWLHDAYGRAYAVGQAVVTNDVIASDSFSNAVVGYVEELDDNVLSAMSNNSGKVAESAWRDMLETLYDQFFISPPSLAIPEGPTTIPMPNRDYFLKLSYADGVKAKLKRELQHEVTEYANVANQV